jgi:hypothetical protein
MSTPFKLKSGNTTPFKQMGSSPMKIGNQLPTAGPSDGGGGTSGGGFPSGGGTGHPGMGSGSSGKTYNRTQK